MRNADIGAVPVSENGRLVGMVTDRDVCCRGIGGGKDVAKLTARDVMSAPVRSCRTDQSVEEAVDLMKSCKIRRLPVLDQENRLVGILSLGDISAVSADATCGSTLKSVSAHHSM
jgi:CBS domain-containing protein